MKERCMNMNHGRAHITISYCPTCGEKVKAMSHPPCSQASHADQRRARGAFCSSCGLKLNGK